MLLLFLIHQAFCTVKQPVCSGGSVIPQIPKGSQPLFLLFQTFLQKLSLSDKDLFLHFWTDYDKFISADPVKLVFCEILHAHLCQMPECLIAVFMAVGIV